jgi:hypothetical protein
MSETTDLALIGLRGEMHLLAEQAPRAAEAAGRAGVQAGLDEASSKVVELANRLTVVLNDGLHRIAAETKASRTESERLRAAGARPAVIRAVWVSALSAAVLMASGAIGGWLLGVHRASLAFHADTALARWAVTPAGRAAYALDKANAGVGGIGIFSGCTGRGWQIRVQSGVRVCWTYTATGGVVAGWRLPAR